MVKIVSSAQKQGPLDNVRKKEGEVQGAHKLNYSQTHPFQGPNLIALMSFNASHTYIQSFLTMPLQGHYVTFEKSRVTHSTIVTFFWTEAVDGFQPKIRHHQGFVPRKF